MQTEVYFSPGEGCVNAIIQQLKSAKKKVDICVFTISDNRIANEIAACHTRKVAVRIITDNHKLLDEGSDILDLIKKGIPTKVDEADAHMHHKFALIDGKVLINGSYNWTRSAALYNQENVMITDEKNFITAFQKEFDRLWGTLVQKK